MFIDTSFDFTTDSPGFWDGFWDRREGLGAGGSDPDIASKTLQKYHQFLWSKELPCGEKMNLEICERMNYLHWKNMYFGSDTIIVSFRYMRYKYMLDQVAKVVGDFRKYIEDYVHRSYTIGGTIIFPKHMGSMNQSKGTNKLICDRWDLTLECIRKYYIGQSSPLINTILRDKSFFDLFVNFKGYVDYFFLQDCVTKDYSKVKFFIGDGTFQENPLPKSVDEYLFFMEKEREFLERRNARIESDCLSK